MHVIRMRGRIHCCLCFILNKILHKKCFGKKSLPSILKVDFEEGKTKKNKNGYREESIIAVQLFAIQCPDGSPLIAFDKQTKHILFNE